MPPPQLTPWILPCAALGSLWFLAVLLLLLVDLRWLAYTTTALALAADAAVVTLVVKGRIPRPHPWTLTAIVLGNMWAVGAAVSAQNIYVSLLPANQALTWLAWVTLVVAFLASAVVGAFLATVLALASARCRKEGPASSETDDVVLAVADPLYNIDWLPVVDTTAPDDGDNGTSAGDRGGGGAIGMGQCPGRKRRTDQRDLLSDVECIKTHHTVDVIVSLTETREMDVMQCSGLAEACAAHGIAHVAFPWRDKFIPEGMDGDAFLEMAVGPTCDLLRQGKRVLVHCNGGKGRTGTYSSKGVWSAITEMRTVRTNMLSNPLQQLYVWHLEHRLRELGERQEANPPEP